MAQDASAAEKLQRYQAVVALCSELDLSVLHPPMADKTPLPLCAISQWDPERLRRVARWKPSDDSGKDLVRTYAKVVLALEELENCAHRIPMHGHAPAAPTAAAPVLNIPPPPVASAAVVLKSAINPASVQAGLPGGVQLLWVSERFSVTAAVSG